MPRFSADARAGIRPAAMTAVVRPAPKLIAYTTIGTMFLVAALVLGRVEPAEVGIVFLGAVVVGLLSGGPPRHRLEARLDRDATLEDEPVTVELEIRSSSGVPWLEMTGPALGQDVGAIALEQDGRRRLSIPMMPRRWGIFKVGPFRMRARDALGFFMFDSEISEPLTLRVFPREESIARAIRPTETQLYSGDEVSKRKGDGIEFAGVRPFAAGDRVRRINWPLSTRMQELHINEAHPERNTDVILFLDAFSELVTGQSSTLQTAVRATASIARHYLRRRDRVGLVSFGGTLRWQLPGMGIRQAYRILDALLRTDAMLSYAWKGIDVIPAQVLPPKALVIAISPLLDERTISALLDLRGRGFDVAIVEVSPLPFLEPPRTEDDRVAYRLWLLKRQGMRDELWRAGMPVTEWTEEQPLVAALQEVERFRRFGRNLRIS
jgi:uncharacterized protein (DUF58 family)